MRPDAANLLSRLGQNSFKYQEFRDNFADMELWPLVEALIRDTRIADDGEARPGADTVSPALQVETPAPAPLRPAGLFNRYEAPAVAAVRKPDDVRSLLRQLGDRVASGEL